MMSGEYVRGEEVIGSMSGEVLRGYVHLGEMKSNRRRVAMKKYDLDGISKANDFTEAASYVLDEVRLMRQLRHPNILPLLSSFIEDSGIVLVSPHAAYGSIRSILNSHYPKGLPELWLLSILRHTLLALEHLHSQGIIHRSIRASHILLDDAGTAILSGFRYATSHPNGSHKESYEYSAHVASTNLNWLSPEILAQKIYKYTEKSDMYSLGVAACEIGNGAIPFSDMETSLMLLEKLRGTTPKLLDASTMEEFGCSESELLMLEFDVYYKNKAFSEDLHMAIEELTQFYPESRPSAAGLLLNGLFRKWKKGISIAPHQGTACADGKRLPESPKDQTEDSGITWNF
eukprot:TRINITY_DN499_c0_g6_i1.p1 TRINITY_DN499_c0_g6~~TRINITY_DN499_c0_g6_i1.p1  ORF type:complete len:345 (+),score=99.97 TRINITY_DN499_c0_g6_i1:48-1082(+)